MKKTTFETLPTMVDELREKLSDIENLLLKKENPIVEQSEKPLIIEEAAEFLSLSVQTIYDKVAKGELPKMKSGKRLYFSKEQLIEYIQEGAVKSNKEIEKEAESYLNNKR
mgnify:CR=1 FL=1